MSESLNDNRKQDLCKLLAENLPTLRTKMGISQNELADRIGYSRQTISAIERMENDMQWRMFSVIVPFFATDEEIYRLMLVMSILDEDVMTTLNIK